VTVLPPTYAVDEFHGWQFVTAKLAVGTNVAAAATAADMTVSRSSRARRSGVQDGEGIFGTP
jgi:hypothetical protein